MVSTVVVPRNIKFGLCTKLFALYLCVVGCSEAGNPLDSRASVLVNKIGLGRDQRRSNPQVSCIGSGQRCELEGLKRCCVGACIQTPNGFLCSKNRQSSNRIQNKMSKFVASYTTCKQKSRKQFNDLKVQDEHRGIDLLVLYPPYTSTVKTIIAHQTNTPAAVRWALAQGANGIEIDLRFINNKPAVFKHSAHSYEPCDCSCLCPLTGNWCSQDNICRALWSETGAHCTASSSAEAMTIALGGEDVRSTLAVIYIDAKLSTVTNHFEAGSNVVKLLNKNVFERGYKGQVILGCSDFSYKEYLKGAMKIVGDSKYADKYFYAFDSAGKDNVMEVWRQSISLHTPYLIYQIGLTVCSSGSYHNAVRESVNMDTYAAVGIWTVDNRDTMQSYLDIGTDTILTNKPAVARKLLNGRYRVAEPGTALVPKPRMLILLNTST